MLLEDDGYETVIYDDTSLDELLVIGDSYALSKITDEDRYEVLSVAQGNP